jgi:hypothetical protein
LVVQRYRRLFSAQGLPLKKSGRDTQLACFSGGKIFELAKDAGELKLAEGFSGSQDSPEEAL